MTGSTVWQYPTRRSLLAAGAALLSWAAMSPGARALGPQPPIAPGTPVRFDIVGLGQTLGEQTVDFDGGNDAFTALTRIDVDARVLGVSLFRYLQHTTETWRRGLLQSFASDGEEEGKPFQVFGRAVSGGFEIEGRAGRIMAPADVMPATYWTPLMLSRPELINPKRGNLKAQAIQGVERVSIAIEGAARPATRYDLRGVIDGAIFYDDNQTWVGAEFHKKGAAISYHLRP